LDEVVAELEEEIGGVELSPEVVPELRCGASGDTLGGKAGAFAALVAAGRDIGGVADAGIIGKPEPTASV